MNSKEISGEKGKPGDNFEDSCKKFLKTIWRDFCTKCSKAISEIIRGGIPE